MTENSSNDYGVASWLLFIICFGLGFLMSLQGLNSYRTDSGGRYLWWASGSVEFAMFAYLFCTPVCFLSLSVYLYRQQNERVPFALSTGIGSITASLLWTVFALAFFGSMNLAGVALSIFFWSGAIVLFGITFILVGIMYLKRGHIILTSLTGLSFVIVGLIAVVVGYIGGFTFFPWFSVYDFPCVTTIAILPCCLALVSERRNLVPVLKDKEGISLE